MNKISIAFMIIAVFFSASTASADNYAGKRRQRQIHEKMVSSAAAHYAAISPEVFRKVEKFMQEKKLQKIGLWHADELGFRIRIASNQDTHHVIITWDGKILKKVYDSWDGEKTFTHLGEWN